MNSRESNFKGTHKEIGELVGKQYRYWGKRELSIPTYVDDYYSKQLSLYENLFPEYISYLEGISVGLEINKDKVLKSYLTGFLPLSWTQPASKCSAFALKNNNGIFIGRNYDWREASEKHSKVIHFEFTDNSSNGFTGISDMSTWKVGVSVGSEKFVISFDEAWNSKGLYIALNGAPGEKQDIGMSSPHLIQLVAEKADNVDRAIELISQIPIHESKIFTLADKNGKLAVVEKSTEKGVKVRESNKLIIATNHYVHPDLLSENIQLFRDVPFHSTFARYHYLQYNLENMFEEMNLDSVNSLMSKPPVVQNWRGISSGDVLTIWINSLNLSNSNYQIQFAPLAESEWIRKI